MAEYIVGDSCSAGMDGDDGSVLCGVLPRVL